MVKHIKAVKKNPTPPDMTEKPAEKAVFATAFHGEEYYRCPHCENSFEYYQAKFRFVKNGDNYICPYCKGKFYFW